jgi:hypothetical protein
MKNSTALWRSFDRIELDSATAVIEWKMNKALWRRRENDGKGDTKRL